MDGQIESECFFCEKPGIYIYSNKKVYPINVRMCEEHKKLAQNKLNENEENFFKIGAQISRENTIK